MTRLGWVILTLVVLAAGAFLAMTSFGGPSLPKVTFEPTRTVPERADARALLRVPVQGVARQAIGDTWGQARSEGREHHGTDIPAPGGTPVLAAADGTIEKLFQSARGGTTLYERSPRGGWIYYYAHLAGYAPGLHEGQRVRAGEPIAFVGGTGDAGPGNTHLHFGLVRTAPGRSWWEGEEVNPYPILAGRAPAR